MGPDRTLHVCRRGGDRSHGDGTPYVLKASVADKTEVNMDRNNRAASVSNRLVPALLVMAAPLFAACGSEARAGSASSQGVSSGESTPHPPPPPTPPQTKEQCDACGGLWAVHGIHPAESCICPTRDSGQTCLDGRDCVGQCLVDADAPFEIMTEGTPPRGFYYGKCSAYDTTFGCNRVIPDGTEEALPLPAEEAAPTLCID
jgi:hypothetical protein